MPHTLPALGFVISGLLAAPAIAQTVDALERLENAAMAAALAHPTTPEAMAAALHPSIGIHEVDDVTARALGPLERMRFEARVLSNDNAAKPAIECTTVAADTARDIWRRDDAGGDTPDALGFLILGDRSSVETPDMARVTFCVAALALSADMIDLDTIDDWYDGMSDRFASLGLDVSRSASSAASYPAGFLQGQGQACTEDSCIVIAAPWTAVWSNGSAGQVSLSVLAIQRVPGS